MAIILLSIIELSCKSMKSKTVSEDNSKEVVADISIKKDSHSCDSLLVLFPNSEKEYLEFYNLTYSKATNEIFLNRYERIKRVALKDSCESLKKFLFMSQFVDGEFADSYYEDAVFIIDNNTQKFCDLYTKYGLKELKQFKEEFDDNCK